MQVRRAYRESVMSVDHYETEYGDTLAKSLATEFSETIADHVVDGQHLTPPLYHTLITTSETARSNRDDFIRLLRRERTSLQTIAADLNDIESDIADLSDRIDVVSASEGFARLDDASATIERRCTELSVRRQKLIHGRSVPSLSGVDESGLVQYLFADLNTETPAFFDIAFCLEIIRKQRRRCLR